MVFSIIIYTIKVMIIMSDELDLKIKFDKLCGELDHDVEQVERFLSFLIIEPDDREDLDKAIKIINKKIKKMKKCTSLKNASKIVKLKKLDREKGY